MNQTQPPMMDDPKKKNNGIPMPPVQIPAVPMSGQPQMPSVPMSGQPQMPSVPMSGQPQMQAQPQMPMPGQLGGDEGGASWWATLLYIIYALLSVFGVYTAYQCGGGIISYLCACCVPWAYLPYIFFSDRNMCGIRGASSVLPVKAAASTAANIVQRGGFMKSK